MRQLSGITTWEDFVRTARGRLESLRPKGGTGLRLLTGNVTSPTLAEQIRTLLKQFPAGKWHVYEPVARDNTREGMRLVLGQETDSLYRFDRADIILSLDSDFLFGEPGSLRYARDFSKRRRVRGEQSDNEPALCCRTDAVDHRFDGRSSPCDRRRPDRLLAEAVARRLGAKLSGGEDPQELAPYKSWIETVAADLQKHRGSSLVVAGEYQPPQVHALAHSMNQLLGNVGNTVVYNEPIDESAGASPLPELVRDMAQGGVDALFIFGSNPAYNAPADLDFHRGAFAKFVSGCILGRYEDETSAVCQWHAPQAHFLETWSDARSFDGTITIMQPLIAPLYGGRSAHELLAALSGHRQHPHMTSCADSGAAAGHGDFDPGGNGALHDGFVARKAAAAYECRASHADASPTQPDTATGDTASRGFELMFRPDPTIWDGRFANNAWLQELPKPLTKITWDNAALISPRTAQTTRIEERRRCRTARSDSRTVAAPVWIHPGSGR